MRTLAALAVAAACLLSPTATAQAALPADQPAAAPAPGHVVRLVTGDVVQVQGGHVQVLPASGDGVAGRLEVQRAGDRIRVVPAAARPYLGRFLDPALFDVTRPVAADGRVPVGLRLDAGAAVPGVTMTSRTTGYLTAASARAFGAALAQQWERDERAGFPERDELFPGVHQVQAQAPAPAPARVAAEGLTLRLRAVDQHGEPVQYASVALLNVDDARRYTDFPDIGRGSTDVQVPAGHYSGLATIEEYDRATRESTTRHVLVEEFALTRDGQVMLFDARRATARVEVSTSRPGVLQGRTVSWHREDAAGRGGIGLSHSDASGEVLVSPTGPAERGGLSWSTSFSLTSPRGTGPYTYDLAWGSDRVAADQRYTVEDDDVATVRTRYYGDPRTLLAGRGAVFPGQQFSTIRLRPLLTPAVRDELVLAQPGTRWRAAVAPDLDGYAVVVDDGLRAYEPGQRTATTWLRPAFFTGIPRPTDPGSAPCDACRSGDVLSLHLAAFRDAVPSHSAFLFDGRRSTNRLRLWRDGRQVVDVGGTRTDVRVPAPPATYRLLTEVDLREGGARLATTLRTETTFRSGRGWGTGLSDRWECGGRECRALPLLQVRAPLPTALDGSLPHGTTVATVVADHVPGSRNVPVTDVDVQTRTGGGPWVDVPVRTQGGGRFAAVLQHPRGQAGQLVDLRISAFDAAGGTVRATTTDAYAVAG